MKYIDIIHTCEDLFSEWLIKRLKLIGREVSRDLAFSDILSIYENELSIDQQHIKPLMKWNEHKTKCYSYTTDKMNGNSKNIQDFMEKTAFDGQVLWLTLQEN